MKEDPNNAAHKDKVISLIKELNLQENKELLDILWKDGKVYGQLDSLIKLNITAPENFANFWEDLVYERTKRSSVFKAVLHRIFVESPEIEKEFGAWFAWFGNDKTETEQRIGFFENMSDKQLANFFVV